MKNKFLNLASLHWPKFLSIVFFALLSMAYMQTFAIGSPYAPAATQDPACTPTEVNCTVSVESVITFSTGLTRSTNTVTNNLSTGVSGGQSVIGGTASGNNLTLSSTSHATKGKLIFGSLSAYDEVTDSLGLGTTSPVGKLQIVGGGSSLEDIIISKSSSSILSSYLGYDGYTNFSGGIGTGGTQRINSIGNLVNIGSIQAGELRLTNAGTFAAKVDYATGSSPYNVSSSDYNGDGKADLAVVNSGSNTVSILINNGSGTFATKVDYDTGSVPQSVSSADYNGDGKIDLAVTNNSSNTVSVFINNGSGTFATKVDYTTGSGPRIVSSADYNGDGKADLAVTNSSSTTMSVFINNGSGTFAAKVDYTTGSTPFGIYSADYNGDSKVDIAVTNINSNTMSVFINSGSGTFAAKVDYDTRATAFDSSPYSISSADYSGDGKIDIAVTNSDSNNFSVFINSGSGTFPTRVDYTTGTTPRRISSADYNGDGKIDISVANYGSTTVSVFINNGSGTFAAKVDYTTGSTPFGVSSADYSGDGKIDLAVVNYNSTTISVFINSASSSLFASGSNGFVGIGNSSPSYSLHVGSASISGIVARFQNSTGTCDVNPTTTSLSCSSDYNLKTNISSLDSSRLWTLDTTTPEENLSYLSRLSLLKPVRYNWKGIENDTLHTGFIAQEVESVFPDLVMTDPTTGLKSLNYIGLSPYIVESIKEMNLNMTSISDFGRKNIWRDSVTSWLSNSTNRITRIFTGEICLTDAGGTECLDRAQVQALKVLINAQIQNTPVQIETPVVVDSTDESPTPDPTDDTEAPTTTTDESNTTNPIQ